MRHLSMFSSLCAFALMAGLSTAALADIKSQALDVGMSTGTPDIKQAGSLAFAPNGILLIGDSVGATVFAVDTKDNVEGQPAQINIEGINKKIAAMVGSTPEETVINDMAVNPASGSIYLSASRGRGPDALPLIFKVDQKGAISEFMLKNVPFASVTFDNAPESREGGRGNPRMSAITDIQFNNGKVIVAGLSNEEFASKLRVFDFPFTGKASDSSIEIYHGAHGQLETRSPVRTFITYENTVLAAYTCTPLVSIPVEDLNGEKIMGKTVAELGNRNNPLDMIVYKKGDQDYLLLANSARGVMKMKLSKSDIDSTEAIKSHIEGGGTAGLEYETLAQFDGVSQLDKLGDAYAVLLIGSDGSFDLKTIALP